MCNELNRGHPYTSAVVESLMRSDGHLSRSVDLATQVAVPSLDQNESPEPTGDGTMAST